MSQTPVTDIAAFNAASTSVGGRVEKAHLPALDGLRGIAILLVLSSHLIDASSIHSRFARALISIPHSGWAGVDLFFVLSGFLITGILLDNKSAPGYFRNFYARRILRIFPLYYAILILVFGLLPYVAAFPQDGLRQLAPEQVWFWTYTSNLRSSITDTELNAPGVFLNHFWSLAIEEQFYVLWPAVVFVCAPRTLARICAAIIVGSPILRVVGALAGLDVWQLTSGTPFHLDSLALGALLAWASRHHEGGLGALFSLAGGVALAALLLLAAMLWRFEGLRQTALEMTITLSLLAAMFGGVLSMLVARPRSAMARAISWSGIRLFGHYSYGLYVFASLLQPYLEKVFATRLINEHLHSFVLSGIVHLVLEVGTCLVVAMLSYHVFEKRFLRLKKYFEYHRPLGADSSTEH
jgi:peptidoglycan/LPS O-acetylase OafA/YrhL